MIEGASEPLAVSTQSDLARIGRGRATINGPLATGGRPSMKLNRYPLKTRTRVDLNSAFAGHFQEPTIGNRRTNYRQPPDLSLLSRSIGWLSQAKIQHSRFGLQSFLQSISVKQSGRTAFKKLGTTTGRPGGAGRKAGHSGENEERQRAAHTPPRDRQFVASMSPAPAEFRRTEFDRQFGLG